MNSTTEYDVGQIKLQKRQADPFRSRNKLVLTDSSSPSTGVPSYFSSHARNASAHFLRRNRGVEHLQGHLPRVGLQHPSLPPPPASPAASFSAIMAPRTIAGQGTASEGHDIDASNRAGAMAPRA